MHIMAMSAKERKQRQLENEQRRLDQLPDATYPFLSTPFYQYLENEPNWSSVELAFDLMGIAPPDFNDDLGPEHYAAEAAVSSDEDRENIFASSKGSIGRAEVMVGCLLDAASELSQIISKYKKRELATRLAALEVADLSTSESRKQALADAANISKLKVELDKNIRRTLPQWRIKVG
jgi:hypothetical protein